MQQQPTRTDPASVQLAPYHPDTCLFRYTHARYLDRVEDIDRIVGQTVDRLREDGLLEDTFVFYFSDHGGVLPRSKGYLYESGLHVPLVVRVPERWKHLVRFRHGERVKGFVEFVDFSATVLHLAGCPIPETMDVEPFLGPDVGAEQLEVRDEALGYADRFDEKYDLVRSLRQGRFKYLRNYQAYYPDGLQNNYRYRMLAYGQWRRLSQQGALNAVQQAFFQPRRPEALYDLESDPHETRNLADDPRYHEVLLRLRAALRTRLTAMPDMSFFPENVLVGRAVEKPIAFGAAQRQRIERLIDTVDLALAPPDRAAGELRRAFQDNDPWVRYWALVACASLGAHAAGLTTDARPLLADPEPLVRLRAAEFLAVADQVDPRPVLRDILASTESYPVAAIALNSVVFVRDALGYPYPVRRADVRAAGELIDRRLAYLTGQTDELGPSNRATRGGCDAFHAPGVPHGRSCASQLGCPHRPRHTTHGGTGIAFLAEGGLSGR